MAVGLSGFGNATHVEVTNAWLRDWPAIQRLHPVGYWTTDNFAAKDQSLYFFNGRGDLIGKVCPPSSCEASISPDGTYTSFLCWKIEEPSVLYTEYVEDAHGHEASCVFKSDGIRTAWSSDDRIAVFNAGSNPGFPSTIGSKEQGLSIPITALPRTVDSLSRGSDSGAHTYVARYPRMLPQIALSLEHGMGAFWMDRCFSKTGTILEGEDVTDLWLSPDGKYIAVIIGGFHPRMMVLQSSDQRVVFTSNLKSPYHDYLLGWSPTGHRFAVGVCILQPALVRARSGNRKPPVHISDEPASSWLCTYDVDANRFQTYPTKFCGWLGGCWTDSSNFLTFGRRTPDGPEALGLLDMKNGAWQLQRSLPPSTTVKPLRS